MLTSTKNNIQSKKYINKPRKRGSTSHGLGTYWPGRKIFTVRFGPASQSIGRGRLSREGALDVRESRERRDKIMPKFISPEKQENAILAWFFPLFCAQDRLLFARVDIGVTEFPTKTAKKYEIKKLCLRFFFKSGRAHSVFNAQWGNLHFILPRKN